MPPEAVQQVLRGLGEGVYETIPVTGEIETLADRYIERGALGENMRNDAEHIAAATIAKVDVLVSWSFRHIVNVRRINLFNEVNRQMGVDEVDIRTPEAFEHER